MNKVEISGGVVRDPEVRTLPSGMTVCDLTVAVNGTRFDPDAGEQVIHTAYIATVWWGHLADKVASLLEKGDEVWLIGELDQVEVETKDGKKDRKTKVRGMVFQPTRKRTTVRRDVPQPEGPF